MQFPGYHVKLRISKSMVMEVAKNKKKKKEKSVKGIYAFGLAFLCYSLFFGFPGFGSIIKALILASLISSLVKNLFPKKRTEEDKPEQTGTKRRPAVSPETKAEPTPAPRPEPIRTTGNPELDEVIRQGRYSVRRIQELNDEIPDYKVSAQLKQIEILTASIIDQVEKQEDRLKQTRQVMNYYLPTTIKLLEQYVQLQNVGLRGENIENGMKRIEDLLDKVIVAFQKQLDSLFERDVIDITADIQVMEQMMASEGLTAEEDFV